MTTETETMTIREMCETFEVTPRTLRFYEAKELLAPIREGQKRLFTRRDRARLVLILKAKRFGFALEDIRQLLDLYVSGGDNRAQLERSHEMGVKRRAEMVAEREALEKAIGDLDRELDQTADRIASLGRLDAAE